MPFTLPYLYLDNERFFKRNIGLYDWECLFGERAVKEESMVNVA